MRRSAIKSIVLSLAIIAYQPSASTGQTGTGIKTSNLDRAIAYAIYLEAHASRLASRTDVCVAFGHGLTVDEKGIFSQLERLKLKVHPNEWCNAGPRGLVISVIAPTTESVPGTYDLTVEVGDLRPIRQNGEHFGTLVRRGTYTVKCTDSSEPELAGYREALPSKS